MSTFFNYLGPLRTGSQAGPSIVIAAKTTMFPQHSSSGPGSLPVPVAEILQSGVTGTAYSETVTAQGGTSPYTFSLVSGALPTGLSLNSSGVISGTPSAAGTSTFTVRVTDTNGSTGDTTFQIIVSSPSSGATNYAFMG